MALGSWSSVGNRKRNRLAWLAGLALAGTYAASLILERKHAGEWPQLDSSAPPAVGRSWKRILARTYEEFNEDRLLALAAGVVFYGLLALFPAVTALVSSYALFADPATIGKHLAAIASVVPHDAYGVIDDQVTRIVTGATGKLSVAFVVGLALALWSANAGVKAMIDALNIVYGVRERRSFLALNALSLVFTTGGILVILLATGSVVVIPVVLSYLPFSGASAFAWLRWPAMFVLLLLALAVLYRFAPDLSHPRWRWISPGATFAAFAWLAGSALLSWYFEAYANYDATYGSLGAVIGLMMWLWMSAIVVLFGAELNSVIDGDDDAHAPFPAKVTRH